MTGAQRMAENKRLSIWGELQGSSWALLIGRRVRITYGEHGQADATGVLTLIHNEFVVLDDKRQLFPHTLELADGDAA